MISHDGYDCIRFERRGHVLDVTIDRPDDELNAVDARLHLELTRLFGELRHERDARAVVLSAEGRVFSAGGDFEWFPQLRSIEALTALQADAKAMINDLLEVEVPIVVALEGAAVGLAATIVLLCDVVVAGEGASLADPHVKVGLVAGDGGAVIWPLAVGPAIAKEFLLTGDAVDSRRAAQLGLVNHVVADGEVLERARAVADVLASRPPLAVRATKAAVNAHVKAAMALVFDRAVAAEVQTFLSADHVEAVAAIVERRDPVFEGR
ncbi:MAG TPA: enoyl-CoA hydratase-related protein [Microthrixaceae bacterium]|nr:enoyl-CoA hydratase-related protein [Microthrixaceae bacterium]